ncbi:TonB-dependent siderophore receptor [Novosphingobium resinovorum]|uniref:TonB-dependent siderophore receptor n=1 Tax=Novosphingobium resinovorum TaxID=158500 RepID=UPI002ED2E80C|nr:TonB-dependent siderophore receptor [Novosphingobium resinovorum]
MTKSRQGSIAFANQAGHPRHGRVLQRLLTGAAGIALAAMPTLAQAQDAEGDKTSGDEIVVTGVTAPTTTSTGLPLTFMETPQSVTIIDQKRIQDYSLTSMKELLKQVVGVNVADYETDRTSYNARGFDVTNFQVDGIGLPLLGNITYGDTDSFQYERIDIVRGANGLTTGIGNPSAMINYVRKRPLGETHVSGAVYAGSWNTWRGELDVSTPINENWGIRVYGAHEEGDSYLDKYSHNRDLIGAVVSGRLTPELTLTAGYSLQEQMSRASSWVGLYFYDTDGNRIDYDRSENSAPSWAYWPTKDQDAYTELAWASGDWTIKGVASYRKYDSAPRLLNPTGNPDTETGYYTGDSSEFTTRSERIMGDLFASGSFHLFGQEHKLTMGLSYARGHVKEYQGRANVGLGLGVVQLPDFNSADRFNPELPTYNPKALTQDETNELLRAYIASQINFTDALHLVAGASYAKLRDKGFSYGQDLDTSQGKLSPYAGLLYDVTPFLTAYASYTSIFYPQNYLDINHHQLDPVRGTNVEGGLKANLFDKRFYVSAAVFRSEQKGLATAAGSVPDEEFGNFFYYTAASKIRSQGLELEVAGRITPNWELSGGYTRLSLKDQDGVKARGFIPRQTLKMSSTYTVPEFNNLSVGAQLRWQNRVETAMLSQGAFAIVDVQAGVDVIENVRASVVVRNLTNKLYFTTLYYGDYGIGQYAAPRSFTASVAYRF